MHRAKTGALLAASLRIGALAARGSAQACDAVTRYGAALGLAFQITDDLLDVMGDPASTGKTRGRDASLGKATYPRLFGVDGARALAHRAVDDARTALCEAGLRSPELHALAGYVAARQG
ncbi:MAG: polyprenyl synthetase family protein [Gemmatimonadota bacterium]|nr:polyprenyl synthetase family protein [Gemmatimonadota bacterium]